MHAAQTHTVPRPSLGLLIIEFKAQFHNFMKFHAGRYLKLEVTHEFLIFANREFQERFWNILQRGISKLKETKKGE